MADPRLARQCALLFVAAAALSVVAVAAGYVIFEHESLASGWWMVRRLKWWALGAAVFGAGAGHLTGRFHGAWVSAAGKPLNFPALGNLYAVLRLFGLFFFHGLVGLVAVSWAFVAN